jgi:hypothetical protein
MKIVKMAILLITVISVVAISCADEETPLICHLYGWARNQTDSTGITNLTLRIRDINPNNISFYRNRETTTITIEDSLDGCFEMDSVCYGTSNQQGYYVFICIDSTENPGYPSQAVQPFIWGEVDTITIYITR